MRKIILGLTIFLSLIISGTASAQTISSQFKAENPAHAVTWALLTWASSDKRGLDFELTEI